MLYAGTHISIESVSDYEVNPGWDEATLKDVAERLDRMSLEDVRRTCEGLGLFEGREGGGIGIDQGMLITILLTDIPPTRLLVTLEGR